jgi:hypothetical protein
MSDSEEVSDVKAVISWAKQHLGTSLPEGWGGCFGGALPYQVPGTGGRVLESDEDGRGSRAYAESEHRSAFEECGNGEQGWWIRWSRWWGW